MSDLKYEVPALDMGRPCKACGKTIHFVETAKGKMMPVEWDGTPHWGNCPAAKDFKKTPVRKIDG